MKLRGQLLDAIHVRPLHLHAQRCLDASQFHVQAVFDRTCPGIREPRKLELLIHLLNEFLVGHPSGPLLPRFEHESGVIHVQWRIVGCAVRATDSAEYAGYFRETAKDTILLLEEHLRLFDGDAWKSGRHVESGAFKESWHELAAQT